MQHCLNTGTAAPRCPLYWRLKVPTHPFEWSVRNNVRAPRRRAGVTETEGASAVNRGTERARLCAQFVTAVSPRRRGYCASALPFSKRIDMPAMCCRRRRRGDAVTPRRQACVPFGIEIGQPRGRPPSPVCRNCSAASPTPYLRRRGPECRRRRSRSATRRSAATDRPRN